MDVGTGVWIRNDEDVWQAVNITSLKPLKVLPDVEDEEDDDEIEEIELKSSDEILLRNQQEKGKPLVRVNDLINLQHLHEASILHVLNERYNEGLIYTATGPIIIALNPFKRMSLYTKEILNKYIIYGNVKNDQAASAAGQALSPHVYGVAANAYRSMCQNMGSNGNQSVLISGESGAGKTVSTKYVMQYLATAGNMADNTLIKNKSGDKAKRKTLKAQEVNAATKVAQQILQSNPILEAFGNARTLRNDNSSRFGKFIKMHFNKEGTLQGATIQTYLLEKVRLVHQNIGERNYHVFYQMTAGCSDEESELWQVFPLEGCRYTNQSDCYERADGVDDADEWKAMREAMDVMNFTPEEQNCLFTTTSAIMHLSCVEFVPLNKAGSTGEEGSRIGLYEAAAAAASLLEVSSDDMESVLCSRTIEAGRQKHVVPNSKERAEYARDAMAKCIYGRMFDWIVRRINSAITSKISRSTSFIGILDIFGFEVFESNSFEQLCINFTNEALQQQFNQFMFKLEQNIYEREGIDWSFIDFPDNEECLSLIERSRTGIIAILDETCIFPKGDDPMFARKLYQKCTDSSCFSASKREVVDNLFAVTHYAGKVVYDTNGFCDKNKDKLHQDVLDLLKVAGLPLIKEIFSDKFLAQAVSSSKRKGTGGRRSTSSTPSPRRGSKYSSIKAASTASQFRNQLNELMVTINDTAPHYIRCIKPNDENEADFFHRSRIVDQLRYGGVLQAVQVARAGYPSRLKHKTFISKYKILLPKQPTFKKTEMKSGCKTILSHIGIEEEDAQIGKTKVFMRKNVYELLEARRSNKLNKSAVQIQSIYRCYVARNAFVTKLYAAIVIASFARGIKAKKRVNELRQLYASICIQSKFRSYVCRAKFMSDRRKWILIQNIYRSKVARYNARHLRLQRSSYVLQKQFRMRLQRRKFKKLRSAITAISCAFRVKAAKKLRKKLYKEAKDVGNLQTELDELKRKLKMAENKSSDTTTEEVANLVQRLEDAQKSKTKVEVELAGHMDKNRRLVKEIAKLTMELKSAKEALEQLNEEKTMTDSLIIQLKTENDENIKHWEVEINDLEQSKSDITEKLQKKNEEQDVKLQDLLGNIEMLKEELKNKKSNSQELEKHEQEKKNLELKMKNILNEKAQEIENLLNEQRLLKNQVIELENGKSLFEQEQQQAEAANKANELEINKLLNDQRALKDHIIELENDKNVSHSTSTLTKSSSSDMASITQQLGGNEIEKLKNELKELYLTNEKLKQQIKYPSVKQLSTSDNMDNNDEINKLRKDNEALKSKLLKFSNSKKGKGSAKNTSIAISTSIKSSSSSSNSSSINNNSGSTTNKNQEEAEYTNKISELEMYNEELNKTNKSYEEKIEDLEEQIQKLINKYGKGEKEFDAKNENDEISNDFFRLKQENEELQNALDDTKFTLEALQVSENEESFSLMQEKNDMEEENTRLKSKVEQLENTINEYKEKYEGQVHIPIEKHMKVTELLDSQLAKNQELRSLHDTLSSSDLLSKEKVQQLEDQLREEKRQVSMLKNKYEDEVGSVKAQCKDYEKKITSQAKKIDVLNVFKKKLSLRLSTLVRDNKRLKVVINTINK